MLNDDEKNRIEDLRKRLYSQSNPTPAVVKRRRIHEIPHEVKGEWDAPEEEIPAVPKAKPVYRDRSVLFKRLLIFSAAFFVLSLAVAAVVYLRGSNVVSPNNVTISVIGPVSVAAGEVLSLNADITNKNNTPIQLGDITFDYPDGTKSAVNLDLPLKSDQIPFDTIASGETVRKISKAILYGEENTHEPVKVTLTYRIPGSNAVFTKSTDYSVLIASAPVSLSIDNMKEVISNQDVTFHVHLVSNAVVDIRNLLLRVDYPFGFTFESATPTPSFQSKIWSLGDLSPGGSKDITLTGKMTGQDGEERVFHFFTGTATTPDDSNIATIFINTSQTVAIKTPFLSSQLTLDGDSSDVHVIESGEIIHGEIKWRNNLPTDVNDASIILKLGGAMLDPASVQADKGFYRSLDNTIIWDKSQVKDLADIPPGGSAAVQFSFNTFAPSFDVEQSFRSPVITLSEDVQGKRISEAQVPETITSSLSRTVKVASNLKITANPVYSIGPFTNTGPIPPKADQTTTYTVNWALTNSYNRADNVTVTATLPIYVKWLGQISPSDEKVSYNASTNQITWQVGQLAPGTGFVNSPKTLSFQVALTPSVSQVGQTPVLVNAPIVTAVDNFTNTPLSQTVGAISTKLPTDPDFNQGEDRVVR